jgi:hypothetical protein
VVEGRGRGNLFMGNTVTGVAKGLANMACS